MGTPHTSLKKATLKAMPSCRLFSWAKRHSRLICIYEHERNCLFTYNNG